ncbi:lysophospholipid acyltransferase family protein [Azospirillum sp. SYSU D00513]|uniref:lysophospholipid acyltransferase family protein n=1 Tax=Azospirillum sp. SYSU D00513 TaxID=2812561 RepID=UPI001A9583BB|nr:lysophospholipid acyltransferase family protein [Azospirillum sp. SYSU D00513]
MASPPRSSSPGSFPPGSALLGGLRLALYLAWTFLLIPVQALAVALRLPLRDRLPLLYHRVCARLVGIEILVRGTPAGSGPVLFVSNHSSYLDITVLGALIPGSFVAKSEVAGWPLFGMLAKLQRTVFVERKARGTVGRQRDELKARLEAGDSLILFPEGTSSDGNRTLPFKTALFAAAGLRIADRPLTVQPVSVTATRLDGIPMGVAFRPFYAWYGDMDLAPHLWQAFRQGRMTVEVEFHPPVTIDDVGSRKALAEHCRAAVAAGVARAVTGRPQPLSQPAPQPLAAKAGAVPPAAGAEEKAGVESAAPRSAHRSGHETEADAAC